MTALPSHSMSGTWQEQLRDSITSIDGLRAAGLITPSVFESILPHAGRYRFALPKQYAKLINVKEGHSCPIFRQAVPSPHEVDEALPPWAQALSVRAYGRATPWQADAIGDKKHLAAPRLTHRYGQRALLHVTTACALYCRFCFRKSHLQSKEQALYGGSLQPALSYLEQHPEIDEVILTGGDPLSMSDAFLTRLIIDLAQLPHLRTLRIHSRMATTLPARFTQALWKALQTRGPHQQVVLVNHFNHPREITRRAVAALQGGRDVGVVMLNQGTMLRGVNNDLAVLTALCQNLWHAGVIPYCMHHPDWTPGTFDFRITIEQGRALMAALVGRVSGPAVPAYVLDVPFGRGKIRLNDSALQKVHEPTAWHNDGRLQGGLWWVQPPHTRHQAAGPTLYLDLAAVHVDPAPPPL